jgi:hypothetical protein
MVETNTDKKAFAVIELIRYTLNQSFSLLVFSSGGRVGAKKHRRHAIPRVRFLKGRSSRAACRAHQRLVGIRKRDDRVAARLQVAITRIIGTAFPVVGL